jgi:pyruvate formate lyase activating enzyme
VHTIFDIQRGSYVDGPGIRTVVFFKGCNLKCAWCHNPESQSPSRELAYYEKRCKGCGKCKELCAYNFESCDLCGACADVCQNGARKIVGLEYTNDDIMREIKKDVLFYEASGGGVTFSGGECMLSIDILEELLKECKSEGIHTAVDTAGRVPYGYFERIIPYTDLFLYDVKMLNSERHKFYTGTDNELILSNLSRLLEARAPLIIRIPVIKDVNDSEEEMKGIKDFLDRHGSPLSVELLPYHGMGEYKYTALGRVVPRFSPPDKDRLAMLKGIFQHK